MMITSTRALNRQHSSPGIGEIRPKGADGVANSVDPALHCLLRPICPLRIITVTGNIMAFYLLLGCLVLWFGHLLS